MRPENVQRGSITIFSILIMLLVTGALLTLLESARIHQVQRIGQIRTESAIESAFSCYETVLWEEYRLLACEMSAVQETLLLCANSSNPDDVRGLNFYRMQVEETELSSYTFLTDGDGQAFVNAVSAYMEQNLLYESANSIYNQYEAVKSLMDGGNGDCAGSIEDALDALEELEKGRQRRARGGGDIFNPLETIKEFQSKALLSLVTEDIEAVSENHQDLAEVVSHRRLAQGREPVLEESNWLDRVFLQQYLLTYFSDYTHVQDEEAWQYELEYLIGGKSSDKHNLSAVVEQLLLVREVANMAYLLADGRKVEEAALLATALGGISCNPIIIETIKFGILAAWAYAESILDVRALLQGKKIPLIKNAQLWTLELENIGKIADRSWCAKESNLGLSYLSYLSILLLFQDDKVLAMRAMDIQELTLRRNNPDAELYMDDLLIHACADVTYRYGSIFMSIGTTDAYADWDYLVRTQASYHYK